LLTGAGMKPICWLLLNSFTQGNFACSSIIERGWHATHTSFPFQFIYPLIGGDSFFVGVH